MKLPKKITIGKWEYNIENNGIGDGLGEHIFDFRKRELKLNSNADIDQNRCSLIHEVLHAISYHYGLKLNEAQVKCLANVLFAVFIDNPDFLKLYV